MADRKKRRKTPAKTVRPLQWLKDATPEEIGEALFAVGPDKTALVVHYLMGRMGPELGRRLEDLQSEVRSDPLGSLARFALGGLGAMKRG